MSFFEDHECSDECPLHNVMFPQEIVASYEDMPLTKVYKGAPEEDTVGVTVITMAGSKHPDEKAGDLQHHVTVAFASEFIFDFIVDVVTEVEASRPGFVGYVVAAVNENVVKRHVDSAFVYSDRIQQALQRWIAAEESGNDE